MPQLSSKKIPYSRTYRITPAMVDTGLDQLIHISDQLLRKFHRDKLQRINSTTNVRSHSCLGIANKRFGFSSSKMYLSRDGRASLDHYGWRQEEKYGSDGEDTGPARQGKGRGWWTAKERG